MLLAVELFGFGILVGVGLTLAILHLRPIRGAAPLSLAAPPNAGTDATTAQIPPHPTVMHMPFYPTADDEYHLRGVQKPSEFQESHAPLEAGRR